MSVVSVCVKWPAQEKREYDSTDGLGSQETEKNADEPRVRAPQGGRRGCKDLMTVRESGEEEETGRIKPRRIGKKRG